MLTLRILGFPIAMLAFAVLYSAAIKAPQVVEATNAVLWLMLPVILIAKLGLKLFIPTKKENQKCRCDS